MHKKLLTDIGFVVLLNLLLKPIWILVDNSAQNEIGHFEYGMFTAAFSFSFLYYQFLDMGLSSLTTKNISTGTGDTDSLIKDSFYLKLLLSFGYVLIVSVMFFFSYNKPFLFEFVMISSLYHICLSFYTWLRAILQGLQKFKTDAFFSVLDKLVLLLLLLYLVITRKLTVHSYGYSFLLSAFVSLLALGGYCLKHLDISGFRLHLKNMFKVFSGTIFLALVNLLFALNDRLVFVLIDGNLSFSETGLYYASYRWVNAISTYLWTILPYFYAKFSFEYHDKASHTDSHFHIKHLMTFIPILVVSAFVFSDGKILFWQQTKSLSKELETMSQLLSIQMVGLLLNSWLTIYGTFLNATSHERFVFGVLLLGSVLNYVLIKYSLAYIGLLGAAWASVSFYAIIGVGFFYFFRRKNPYHYPSKHFVAQAFAVAVFVVVAFLLKKVNLPMFLPGVISVTVFLGIMVFLGEINLKLVREALGRKD